MNIFTTNFHRTVIGLILVALPGLNAGLTAQGGGPPSDFVKECVGDPLNGGVLFASITINGVDAVPGEDFVAIFDTDGFVVGVGEVTSGAFATNCDPPRTGVQINVSGINGTVTPDNTCPENYGAVVGETMTGLVYDGSGPFPTYYELPGNLTFRTAPPILPGGSTCNPVDAIEVVLPATLNAFRGTAAGPKHVRLNWEVAREENVSFYEVHRSTNGRSWDVIDEVASLGDTETARDYAYDDLDPDGTRAFYRLRMVDFDGAEEFSGIVIVELDQSGERTLSVFPNPATNASRLGILLGGDWSNDAPVLAGIYDINGRLLARYDQLQSGTSSVALPSGIQSGLYLLRVTQADQSLTHKVSVR